MSSFKNEKQEASLKLEYNFPQDVFRLHDPQGLIAKHCSLLGMTWPSTHEEWENESPHENVESWDDVLDIMKTDEERTNE